MEETLTMETRMETAISTLSGILEIVERANSRLKEISEKTVKSFDELNEIMLPGGHRWENPKPTNARYPDVLTESVSIIIETLESRLSTTREAEDMKNPLVALGGEEFYQSMTTLPDIAISHIDDVDENLLSMKVSIPSSEFTVGELILMHSRTEYLVELDIVHQRMTNKQILEPIYRDSDKRECLEKYAHILPETLKSPVYGDFVVCKILCDYDDINLGVVNFIINIKPWLTSKREQVFYKDVVRMLIERYLEKHPEDEYI